MKPMYVFIDSVKCNTQITVQEPIAKLDLVNNHRNNNKLKRRHNEKI
jgi:hypothetical protein